MALVDIPRSVLSQVRDICEAKGITLESLIDSLNEVRTESMTYAKDGTVAGEDHSLRLKATMTLLAVLQVPLLTKISAIKEASRSTDSLDIEELVRAKQLEDQKARTVDAEVIPNA